MIDFEENEFVLIDGNFYKVIFDDGDELVTCYRFDNSNQNEFAKSFVKKITKENYTNWLYDNMNNPPKTKEENDWDKEVSDYLQKKWNIVSKI